MGIGKLDEMFEDINHSQKSEWTVVNRVNEEVIPGIQGNDVLLQNQNAEENRNVQQNAHVQPELVMQNMTFDLAQLSHEQTERYFTEKKHVFEFKDAERNLTKEDSISFTEQENASIGKALADKNLEISDSLKARLSNREARNASHILLNSTKLFGDSVEMTNIKNAIKGIERTLDERITNLNFQDVILDLKNKYRTAIDFCKYYVENKTTHMGNSRFILVKNKMKGLLEEYSLVMSYAEAFMNNPNGDVNYPMDGHDILFISRVAKFGERLKPREKKDGNPEERPAVLNDREREDFNNAVNSVDSVAVKIINILKNDVAEADKAKKAGDDNANLLSFVTSMLQGFGKGVHVEFFHTAFAGLDSGVLKRTYKQNRKTKVCNTLLGLKQEEDGTLSIIIDNREHRLPYKRDTLLNRLEKEIVEHENIYGTAEAAGIMGAAEEQENKDAMIVKNECKRLIGRYIKVKNHIFDNIPVEDVRYIAVKVMKNEWTSKDVETYISNFEISAAEKKQAVIADDNAEIVNDVQKKPITAVQINTSDTLAMLDTVKTERENVNNTIKFVKQEKTEERKDITAGRLKYEKLKLMVQLDYEKTVSEKDKLQKTLDGVKKAFDNSKTAYEEIKAKYDKSQEMVNAYNANSRKIKDLEQQLNSGELSDEEKNAYINEITLLNEKQNELKKGPDSADKDDLFHQDSLLFEVLKSLKEQYDSNKTKWDNCARELEKLEQLKQKITELDARIEASLRKLRGEQPAEGENPDEQQLEQNEWKPEEKKVLEFISDMIYDSNTWEYDTAPAKPGERIKTVFKRHINTLLDIVIDDSALKNVLKAIPDEGTRVSLDEKIQEFRFESLKKILGQEDDFEGSIEDLKTLYDEKKNSIIGKIALFAAENMFKAYFFSDLANDKMAELEKNIDELVEAEASEIQRNINEAMGIPQETEPNEAEVKNNQNINVAEGMREKDNDISQPQGMREKEEDILLAGGMKEKDVEIPLSAPQNKAQTVQNNKSQNVQKVNAQNSSKAKTEAEQKSEKLSPRQELNAILEESMNSDKGQKKFTENVIRSYFTGASTLDKRSMLGNALRYLKPVNLNSDRNDNKEDDNVKNTSKYADMMGGFVKGAGPLFQKMLQGMPTKDADPVTLKLLADIKSNLSSIPHEIVEAQMYNIVKRSNGAITKIEVLKSLGAASVGQAFLCKIYGNEPDKLEGKEVVVKLLRSDARNRMMREKDIMLKAAEKTSNSMKKTYEGMLSRIEDEFDLTIESDFVEAGQLYNNRRTGEKHSGTVEAMKVEKSVASTSTSMVCEKAPGTTVDRYFKELDQFTIDTMGEFLNFKIVDGNITARDKDGNFEYVDFMKLGLEDYKKFGELKNKLNVKLQEIMVRQKKLITLAERWVEQGLYRDGFYHGDLHAGNIMISDEQATLIDFGNCTQLSEEQKKHVSIMLSATAVADSNEFIKSFYQLIDDKSTEITQAQKDQFREWVEKIFSKGDVNVSGERIITALTKAQELDIPLPSAIYNFSQSQIRLQNTIDSMNKYANELNGFIEKIKSSELNKALDSKVGILNAWETYKTQKQDKESDSHYIKRMKKTKSDLKQFALKQSTLYIRKQICDKALNDGDRDALELPINKYRNTNYTCNYEEVSEVINNFKMYDDRAKNIINNAVDVENTDESIIETVEQLNICNARLEERMNNEVDKYIEQNEYFANMGVYSNFYSPEGYINKLMKDKNFDENIRDLYLPIFLNPQYYSEVQADVEAFIIEHDDICNKMDECYQKITLIDGNTNYTAEEKEKKRKILNSVRYYYNIKLRDNAQNFIAKIEKWTYDKTDEFTFEHSWKAQEEKNKADTFKSPDDFCDAMGNVIRNNLTTSLSRLPFGLMVNVVVENMKQ